MLFRRWNENKIAKEKEINNLIKEVDYLKEEQKMLKRRINLLNNTYIEEEFSKIYEEGVLKMNYPQFGECDEILLTNDKFYYHLYITEGIYGGYCTQKNHHKREITKKEALKIYKKYCHQKAYILG